MTDREMLELAAKAAGITVWFPRMSDGKGGVVTPCHTETIGEGTVPWNPLLDDAQALRLAVKLDFGVFTSNKRGTSWACNNRGDNIAEVLHDDAVNYDPLAATRRAIVRAAAEIGKSMETQDDHRQPAAAATTRV